MRDEYAAEVLDTLRGMAITLSDEQKAETAYHHDRYGNDLLFLYFASKSTGISAVTQKLSVFSCFLCKRKFGFTKPKIKSKIKKDSRKAVLMVRMFITNLKSTLKIRLKAHIFPRTFADLLPLCYDYNTKH